MIAFIALLGTFEKILNFVMFIDIIALGAGAGTIFLIRKKNPVSSYSGFRIAAYPFLPAFFILVLFAVWIHVIIADPESSLYGLIVFTSALPLYYLLRRKT
jgi:APA family basic amino acid/polyamine antiporter